MSNFWDDLKFGEHWEMKFLEHIEFDSYVKKAGCFKPYDLKVYHNNKITRYEVKADRMTYKTKNIAIEYECRNKPSGITTTRAKKWAYFELIPNGYILYLIPVRRIRKFIDLNMYKRTCSGGDNFQSQMYLFDRQVFKNYIIYHSKNIKKN